MSCRLDTTPKKTEELKDTTECKPRYAKSSWVHLLKRASLYFNKRPIGHIAHLSHLSQYLEIFSLYMHFIFFCGQNKQFHVTCKGSHYLGTPQTRICDIRVGISTVFEIIGNFLFKGGVRWTTPHGHDYIHVPSHVPWNKEQEYLLSIGEDLNGF
jgi:hypothetical protein